MDVSTNVLYFALFDVVVQWSGFIVSAILQVGNHSTRTKTFCQPRITSQPTIEVRTGRSVLRNFCVIVDDRSNNSSPIKGCGQHGGELLATSS